MAKLSLLCMTLEILKKVKNFYIVSQFLATGEGWCRRDTSQEKENKNFQVIFLVSSENCLLTWDNSQSLDLNPWQVAVMNCLVPEELKYNIYTMCLKEKDKLFVLVIYLCYSIWTSSCKPAWHRYSEYDTVTRALWAELKAMKYHLGMHKTVETEFQYVDDDDDDSHGVFAI